MNIFHLRNRFFLFLICFFLTALGLHLLNKKIQYKPLSLFFEIQSTLLGFKLEISNLVKKYSFLLDLRSKNQQLERQNKILQAQQQLCDEILTENERLKTLIQFPSNRSFNFLPAQVISTDLLNKNELIMINKGSRDGVKKFMGVLHPKGIVGYIFRVSPSSAQVISLLSPLSSIPARIQTSRITGLLSNGPGKLLSFSYADSTSIENQNANKLKIKSPLVTVKSNQFPAGFLIGNILSVTSSSNHMEPEVYVQPAVDFFSLEEVLVLKLKNKSKLPVYQKQKDKHGN